MKKEKRIPFDYQIPVSEFEKIRKIIAKEFGVKYTSNLHVGQIIISNFAYNELKMESCMHDKNLLRDIQTISYKPILPSDKVVRVTAQILPGKFSFMQAQLRKIYFPILADKDKNSNDFLGQLGFEFAQRLIRGEAKIWV